MKEAKHKLPLNVIVQFSKEFLLCWHQMRSQTTVNKQWLRQYNTWSTRGNDWNHWTGSKKSITATRHKGKSCCWTDLNEADQDPKELECQEFLQVKCFHNKRFLDNILRHQIFYIYLIFLSNLQIFLHLLDFLWVTTSEIIMQFLRRPE